MSTVLTVVISSFNLVSVFFNRFNYRRVRGQASFILNYVFKTFSLPLPLPQVNKDQLIKGFLYGRTHVPLDKIDEMAMSYKPSAAFCVLGFTKTSSIPRSDLMGTVNCVAPADASASLAFSAFAFALYETNRAAIVRFCTRGKVTLGALFPSIKSRYEALLFAKLPFAEDIRDYAFPSLTRRGPQRSTAPHPPNSARRLTSSTPWG